MPTVHSADRVLGSHPAIGAIGQRGGLGAGQEFGHSRGHRHWSRPGPSPAMWGGEGLVQVHVDDVKAHVAGSNYTQDGVQVRSVVIKQPADFVNGGSDLSNVFFEETSRVRIGQHDARHVRSK